MLEALSLLSTVPASEHDSIPAPRLYLCSLLSHRSIDALKMSYSLIRVCVVGGNAVSAFLSWRLQATNACDVTLVWKSGFDAVYQYGISFKYGSLAPLMPPRARSRPTNICQVHIFWQ